MSIKAAIRHEIEINERVSVFKCNSSLPCGHSYRIFSDSEIYLGFSRGMILVDVFDSDDEALFYVRRLLKECRLYCN